MTEDGAQLAKGAFEGFESLLNLFGDKEVGVVDRGFRVFEFLPDAIPGPV